MDFVLCTAPLQVQFISNTPVVQGANIHAQFIISRPATHVICNLLPEASDKVNCKFSLIGTPDTLLIVHYYLYILLPSG